MFDKLLIANRGEIACRVLRTCRRLGIRTVAVYSSADADAQHVRLADEALPIGGPTPTESYLRGDAIIEAALRSGAQAIHPGYGFLSENAEFADAVEAAGLVFIGPGSASMRKMGSKAGAKELMAAAGVPVTPGYTGEDQSVETLTREALKIGFPLMIKAAHGGGGKGMRIVREDREFAGQLESCRREAANAFGRDRVLLERYVESPRHIEIQVFGDSHGQVVHLFERECSAQRRYQKVLEESPSASLSTAQRNAMGAAAVQAARALDYVNAGTVEFIVAPDGDFYFMEINTRLQVEHPVTEMTTGLDLVEWQLRVAAGEPLPLAQPQIRQHGHAIEVRLYAEDPDAGFLPASGRLDTLRLPAATENVRIDSGVIEGDTVTIFYDPMIAKLIVHDQDRPRALARMRNALADCAIVGPKSNLGFLERLLRHPAVVEARIDTGYLDRHPDEFLPERTAAPALLAAASTAELLIRETAMRERQRHGGDPTSPWAIADGWRLGEPAWQRLAFLHDGHELELAARGHDGDYLLEHEGRTWRIEGAHVDGDALVLRINGQARRLRMLRGDGWIDVHDGERHLRLAPLAAYRHIGTADAHGDARIVAPMPGRVVVVKARPGDKVLAGQELLVVEAMKMELALKSPRDGIVAELRAAAGDFVEADALLAVLEPAA